MVKMKPIAKTSGFSYLELILSLSMLMNLFVLLTQIFYNIDIENKISLSKKPLLYETAGLRIENDLKTATNVMIGEHDLVYVFRNQSYKYYVQNNNFILLFNGTTVTDYIDHVTSVTLRKEDGFLYFSFLDTVGLRYEMRIIYDP